MKTFLKIMLVVMLLFVAIKLSPLIFGATIIGLLVAAILGAAGLSILAVFLAIFVGLATVLAPIWIPVLLIVGVIALFKKINQRSAPPAMSA